MGHRLSKIYTRTGDNGSTGLGDGSRVAKDDVRVEAYGTIDELNSVIALLAQQDLVSAEILTLLTEIQHDLFDIGGELSVPGYSIVTAAYTDRLENALDVLNQNLPPLKEFILPGGNQAAAIAHLARTVARRAERRLITLHQQTPINPAILTYVNRLSDYLFVVGRVLARSHGGTEVLWQRQR